jgi:hypothetical protein
MFGNRHSVTFILVSSPEGRDDCLRMVLSFLAVVALLGGDFGEGRVVI